MNTGNRDLYSESEKEIEDVKLLIESMKYQKDDPSQRQQALRALGEILSQNSKLIVINVSLSRLMSTLHNVTSFDHTLRREMKSFPLFFNPCQL